MLQVIPGHWATAVAIGVVWVGCFLVVAVAGRCLQVCLKHACGAPSGELQIIAFLCVDIDMLGAGPVAGI